MAYVNLGQVMYPIGAYFFSNNSTSPSNLFGGTWSAIDAGRFICAAGSGYNAGAQGGASSVTLSATQMPRHNHYFSARTGYSITSTSYAGIGTSSQFEQELGPNYRKNYYSTDFTGSGSSHENRPLYRAAYIWRRTA